MTTAAKKPASKLHPRPAVLLTKPAKAPKTEERTLANGLRVVAVRRPTVPLVEMRLRVPWAAGTGTQERIDAHVARGMVLGETLLAGTTNRTSRTLAEELQGIGGSLGVAVDSDRLVISGSSLASSLKPLLAILADVIDNANYPEVEVEGERERLEQELTIARSIPAVLAGAALGRRLHGAHPYARELAQASAVAAVKPAALRTLHKSRVRPGGGLLLLVGDIAPKAALDAVEAALGGWEAGTRAPKPPALPAILPGPLVLVDRPGAVQSNLRLAGHALRRDEEGYASLQLVNVVFGGYFSSRLVANLRENKGYTYSPRSSIDHTALGSFISVSADVATEVTAPALVETAYELGRIATLPVTQAELDAARNYAIGTLALGTSSQAGLASTLMTLLAAGLPIDWLREQPSRLAAVTVSSAQEAAARFLAPSRLVQLVLGDSSRVEAGLLGLGPVESTTTEGL